MPTQPGEDVDLVRLELLARSSYSPAALEVGGDRVLVESQARRQPREDRDEAGPCDFGGRELERTGVSLRRVA
jgi:hypothetical protein